MNIDASKMFLSS